MMIEEKKELVLGTFRSLLDLGASYTLHQLSPEEIKQLDEDDSFQARVKFYEIIRKQEIIQNLITLSGSENEKIALSATMELGKIIYPEKFNVKVGKEEDKKDLPPITINNIIEEKRKAQEDNAEEVLRILCESGVFQSETEDTTDGKIQ